MIGERIEPKRALRGPFWLRPKFGLRLVGSQLGVEIVVIDPEPAPWCDRAMLFMRKPCLSLVLLCALFACNDDGSSDTGGEAAADETATGTAGTETDGSGPDSGEGNGEEGGGGGGAGCGNGVAEPGEDCDGSDLGGQDCTDVGFVTGVLSCDDTCHFDTSSCSAQLCGNGMIEGDEQCDGAQLGGTDCSDLQLGQGTPSCTENCTLDTSSCGEGSSCGLLMPCPNKLACVSNSCYDGSAGDPCKTNNQCQSGNCVGAGVFQDGTCD